jgi:ribonucleoside-diphosphate reductase beta chain
MGLLVDGITLYHIFIEGAMALAGQTRMLQLYKEMNVFPGFQKGFLDVTRDESRHVLFGVKFLYDMVQSDNRYAYRIVDFLNPLLPDLYEFGRPRADFIPAMLAQGQDLDWTPKFYASSLRRKLRAIGIHANIPDPKPTAVPPEVQAMLSQN